MRDSLVTTQKPVRSLTRSAHMKLEHVTIVHIGVVHHRSGIAAKVHPIELKVFPEEAVIFYPRTSHAVEPHLPTKVRWEVDGLKTGEQIEIKAKGKLAYRDGLPEAPYIIEPGDNSVESVAGRPVSGKGGKLYWSYEIDLVKHDPVTQTSTLLATLDPTIIIEPNP